MSLYNTTLSQPFVFAAFLYLGIICGIVHSAVRGLCGIFGKGRAASFAADMVFLVAAGGLFLFALYRITGFKIRGYYFLGTICGYSLYSCALRPLIIWLNCKLRKKKIDNSRGK